MFVDLVGAFVVEDCIITRRSRRHSMGAATGLLDDVILEVAGREEPLFFLLLACGGMISSDSVLRRRSRWSIIPSGTITSMRLLVY
jgi:hypothetical protein